MEPLYKIQEQTTIGWEDWDPSQDAMTKENCQELYQQLLGDGTNPDDLRIIRVS